MFSANCYVRDQVRRYVYHDVVRLGDLEKLIDCSCVQTYTINSAKVIFLKPRPQSRPFKGSGNICLTCDRILQEPFHFCSLSCKVDHVMTQGGDLSNILQHYGAGGGGGGGTADPDRLAFPRFENLRVVDGSDLDDDVQVVTPDSTLEDPTNNAGGGSSDNGTDDARRQVVVHGGGEAAKRKKGGGFLPQIVLSLGGGGGGGGNRRKGAPHRSPLA